MNIQDVQLELGNLAIDRAKYYWPLGYILSDTPRDNYEDMVTEYHARGLLTVWTGASDETIFGQPYLNWAFRTWHDAVHINLHADFSYEHEIRVQECQQQEALQWCKNYGVSEEKTDFILLLLEAEIKGQLDYQLEHGEFPVDQVKFTEEYIERKLHAASTKEPSIQNALR